jgi:hypothetical protein
MPTGLAAAGGVATAARAVGEAGVGRSEEGRPGMILKRTAEVAGGEGGGEVKGAARGSRRSVARMPVIAT